VKVTISLLKNLYFVVIPSGARDLQFFSIQEKLQIPRRSRSSE